MMPHERRLSLRKPLKHLSYLSLSRDNGGIVLDVSEGGLRFRSIAPVVADGPIRFRFAIDSAVRIAAIGELAWKDETGKTGGLRFTQLPDEIREQIHVWAGQGKNGAKATAKASTKTHRDVSTQTEAKASATASATDIPAANPPTVTELSTTSKAVLAPAAATPLIKPEITTGVTPDRRSDSLPASGATRNPLLYDTMAPVRSAPSDAFSMFPLGLNSEARMPGLTAPPNIGIKHPIAAVVLTAALALVASVGIFSYVLTSPASQSFVEWGEKAWSGFYSQGVPPETALPPSAPDSSKQPQ